MEKRKSGKERKHLTTVRRNVEERRCGRCCGKSGRWCGRQVSPNRTGNNSVGHIPAMGRAGEVPARWIQLWSYYFCPFPAINTFMACNKYFRWMLGDCAASEIILGSIFRPSVGQFKYLEDEYSCHIIVFAHFRPSKNLWQARNILGGGQVTVPDRK